MVRPTAPRPRPRPRTAVGRAGLAALRATPDRALIALDFDGTLAPIVPRPEDARPAPGAVAALRRLAALGATVAVVTGRPADWVAVTAGLSEVPGLVVAGQYGAQRWSAGRLDPGRPDPGLAAVRAALPAVLAAGDPALWLEDKGLALVVHSRAAADPAAALAGVAAAVRRLAAEHGLQAYDGRYVLEVRPAGHDKGGALRALVEELRPGTVLYAGDDVGDLPAFAEVAAGRPAGRPGVSVAVVAGGPDEPPELAAAADLLVAGPAGLVGLLADLAGASGDPAGDHGSPSPERMSRPTTEGAGQDAPDG